MTFWQAIVSGFSNYANFSGRAARSEYWYWVLAGLIAGLITYAIDYAIGIRLTNSILSLATILPSLALGARRLHDMDHSGWWMLLLLTGIGGFVLLIWFTFRGTPAPNRFGPDRLVELGHLSPHPAA